MSWVCCLAVPLRWMLTTTTTTAATAAMCIKPFLHHTTITAALTRGSRGPESSAVLLRGDQHPPQPQNRSLMNDSKDVNNAITSIPVHHPLPVLHRQMFQLPVGFPVAQDASIHLLTCSTVIAIIICQTRRFFSYD